MTAYLLGLAFCAVVSTIFAMFRKENLAEYVMRLVFCIGFYSIFYYFINI